ncbi:hypothetical protein B0A55_05329 [Friedmanniomyces simplex]|uniref:Ribosome-assembly protein 3 C-terminal domain-containing protein n=1 Tax=Friedmanniomyces simplex TaxID=329884 RepID=A0A4U0XFX5_9PEZI|nr:hypothetical protein B0A55_05329 [Friedmanniomyces simplex]
MAPAKATSKRKNKLSSHYSSDSEAASPASPTPNKDDIVVEDPKSPRVSHHNGEASNSDPEADPVFTKRGLGVPNPDQAFEDFYLRQATKEFANDLDKLRAANDSHETGSIALIVGALRQGTACLGREERVRVGGASGGGGGGEGE